MTVPRSVLPHALFALLALARAAPAQDPPSFQATFLGPASAITDLSENGFVVGQVAVGSATRGWVASATLPLTWLPLAPGDQSSWANDVNELGVVVGAASALSSPEFAGRAVAWTPDGRGGWTLVELGQLPGHSGGNATALNDQGDIVGWSQSGMFRHAVWFTSPSGVLDLDPFGIFDPQSINEQRQLCDRTGRRMDLDTMTVETLTLPPGPPSYQAALGYSINAFGQVAGTLVLATSTSCVYQAARWVDGTGWQTLTSCSPVANAYDVNDHGDVLYKAALSLLNLLHLEGYGEFTLEELLSPAASAWDVLGFNADINSARQVAVIASNAGTGQSGAVLLTPNWTCQASLGFAGPGPSQLVICGGDLSSGTTADLTLYGVPAHATVFLVAGLSAAPTPFKGGTLVPLPVLVLQALLASPAGTLWVPGIPGGHGPVSVYVQCLHPDGQYPGGFGFSNAVRLDVLP